MAITGNPRGFPVIMEGTGHETVKDFLENHRMNACLEY